MLRKVLFGSGLVAFVPTIKAATPVPNEAATGPQKPTPMRPSELPIYEAPHAHYGEFLDSKAKEEKVSYVRTALEPPISAVREQVQNVWQQTAAVTNSIQDKYQELHDRSDWIVKYLREEENKQQRYGAVAMGGLTGFILGLRGGFIKRLFYVGIGTSAMGALCFPQETKEIYKNNGALARQYINIAYNFLYGVKPGDPQLEVKFPELSFPKDFSEFVNLTASLASSAKQAVMPPPSKETDESKLSKKKD